MNSPHLLQNIIDQCTFFNFSSSSPNFVIQGNGTFIKPQLYSSTDNSDKNSKPVTIFNQPAFSVSMSERKQREIHNSSHCGARTLFVSSPPKNEILLRGANKFFDLQQAFHQIESNKQETNNNSNSPVVVIPLRKAAGFFCMFFCDDYGENGKTIRCSSKHSLSGIHVDVATKIFLKQQHEELAKFLFENKLALLAECVLKSSENFELFSSFHPADDNDLLLSSQQESTSSQGEIFCFALQKMNTVTEWSLNHHDFEEKFLQLAKNTNLKMVPKVEFSNNFESGILSQMIRNLVFRATKTASSTTVFCREENSEILQGEGVVLLIDGHKQKGNNNNNQDDGFCQPIRLKIKTCQYQTARNFRSLFEEKSSEATTAFSTPLLLAVSIWYSLFLTRTTSSEDSKKKSWEQLVADFFAQNTKIDTQNNKILQKLDRDACLRHRAQLLNPRFLILLSGLPGSGKSSVSAALKQKLIQHFRSRGEDDDEKNIRISIIERDSFVPLLPEGSSKHAQRAARKAAHRGFMRALRHGGDEHNVDDDHDDNNSDRRRHLFFSLPKTPHVIIADACHASFGARETTRQCVAPYRLGITCHLRCTDRKKLVLRILKRKGHRVLKGGEDIGDDAVANIEKAIFDVASAFEVPEEDVFAEGGDPIIRFDVDGGNLSPSDMAQEIFDKHLKGGIENFLKDMNQVENGSDVEDEDEATIYDWRFFQENFFTNDNPPPPVSLREFCSNFLPSNSSSSSILTIRLVPPKESQASEWKSFLMERIVSPLLQTYLDKNNNNSPVAGHTKWIQPYFLKNKTEDSSCSISDCILRKFSDDEKEAQKDDDDDDDVHITLLHSNDFEKKTIPQEMSRFWLSKSSSSSENCPTIFKIKPTFVALDRRILAVEVEISDVNNNNSDQNGLPLHHQKILHITVCHSSRVSPTYALELLSRKPNLEKTLTGRRQRENKDDDQEHQHDEISSKNQKRKQFDQQFCVLKCEEGKQDSDEEHEKYLFGIVESLAKH
jgi:hypothetical protein